jgi:hypothetical protein
MKKTLLLSVIFVFSLFGISQDVLLEEYFNDSINLPSNWTTIDADGDTYNWRINTWETEIYAVSDSWLSGIGPLTPENYLVSPQISLAGLDGTLQLRYTIQVANMEWPAETYKVAVSTTGNQAEDFTNILITETTDTTMYYIWVERLLDLTEFIGDSIYITWCHFDTYDMYKLLLDSIQLTYTPNTGIDISSGKELSVYPNPAREKLFIKGDLNNSALMFYSADGRLVYSGEAESNEKMIDLTGYTEGLYFLNVETNKGLITRKVSIIR